MNKGFTLMELLVAIFSGLLILSALVFFYITLQRSWSAQFFEQNANNQFIALSQKIRAQLIENKQQQLDLTVLPETADLRQEIILINGAKIVSVSALVTAPQPPYQTYRYEHLFRVRQP